MDYALNFPQHLGLHLKSLRKAKGMSQAGLASLLQVTQSRIAAIEKDPSAVSVGQMMAILDLLGAQLVVRAQTPPPEAALSGAAPQVGESTSKNKQSTVVAHQAAPAQRLESTQGAQPLKHTVLADGWQSHKPQGRW